MIELMNKYSFILLSEDKETFLQKLQDLGVIDITRSTKPVDNTSLAILDEIGAVKAEIACIEKGSDSHLTSLLARRAELEKEATKAKIWGSFDAAALEDLESKGLKISFYSVPSKKFDPEWEQQFALQVIEERKGITYFAVVAADNFPLKALPAPARSSEDINKEIEALDTQIERYRATLADRTSEIPALKEKISKLTSDLDRYLAGVKAENAAEDILCCFEGFAPVSCAESIAEALDSTDAYYWCEPASKEDNPPIKLRNNRFSKLFESITAMYGLPVYDEFDPTPVLAIFFMLFFALCMGDAGYGIVLMLFGVAVNKKWVNIQMFSKIGTLISVLGVATFIVGLLLGTFFGIDLATASWVPEGAKKYILSGEIAGYDIKMVLALIIGVFHICLAMIIKSVGSVKRFGLKNNPGTLGWTLLVVGIVIVAAVALLKLVPMDIAKWVVIGIAGLSALGIFIFNKPGRNPLLNIGSGLWDTYQMVTGLLGDVLSYIRLYALGLAGGMLGGAFNNLAGMVAGEHPTWQWVFVIVILLFGHILNILMSCLGAFVHPLRLTFVEYFKNSGYEGKGLRYNPLKK